MEKNDKYIISGILVFIGIGLAIDVWTDWLAGAAYYHVYLEAAVVFVSTFGIYWIWKDNSTLRSNIKGVNQELIISKVESEKWRKEHQSLIQGLGSAIEKQLIAWEFSLTERDIAILLLKGLSFKEIADLRNGSEKTVRQHSLKIYEKSNLAGRAELSAFFLEDLLAPIEMSKPSNSK